MSFVKRPICEGIDPSKFLLKRLRLSKAESNPNWEGMEPLGRFNHSSANTTGVSLLWGTFVLQSKLQ